MSTERAAPITPRAADRRRPAGVAWTRARRHGGSLLLYGLLLLIGLIVAFPFYWVLTASIKEVAEIRAIPPTLWPRSFTLAAYEAVWGGRMARFFLNSLVYAGGVTAIDLFTSTLIGYVLIKHPSRLGDSIFWLILAATMVPLITYLLPLFQVLILLQNLLRLPLIDSYLGMILPWVISPFGVFLMRQAMYSVPNDLLDAARIDGAGDWGLFARVALPLVRPNMAALALLVFIYRYDDLLWPLMVAQRPEMYPVTLGLVEYIGDFFVEYDRYTAAAVLAILPILALYLIVQRFIIEGVATQGLKG